MSVTKRNKISSKEAYDPKKESLFKELSSTLAAAGYSVRREKLKAGPGWRAISGSCRAEEQKLIILDSRMPQNDQITFLSKKIEELGISSKAENIEVAL